MTELQKYLSALTPKKRKAFKHYCTVQKLTQKEIAKAITKGDTTLRARYVISQAVGIPMEDLFAPYKNKQLQIFN